MGYNYVLLEEAQKEYETSLKWYMERSTSAAERFVNAIENVLSIISEHPKRWHNIYKNYYELRLKKFPFTIIYVIEENEQQVIITAIYHNKRNPKKKYRKL